LKLDNSTRLADTDCSSFIKTSGNFVHEDLLLKTGINNIFFPSIILYYS